MREIWPSWFVSTDSKLGVELSLELEPDEADGVDVEDDGVLDVDEDGELVELLPDIDGDEDEGLVVDDEDCATAAVDSAKSTAAVRMLRFLGIGKTSDSWETAAASGASAVPLPLFRRLRRSRKAPRSAGLG